ncbi:hypothetical protein SAMN04488695_11455 [Proteiniclasticum ruminis]|uniref:Uncharacterized protein n=1 Tax=Proteiniclasticum ruminis TaxID=398199 RepID=A0A1I5E917_9CLOT|nr:hypothetical protein SAMN04488695_11455 [Proteiniclasticum ruminis]
MIFECKKMENLEGEKRTTEKHNIFKSRYIINMVIILSSYRRRAYGVV